MVEEQEKMRSDRSVFLPSEHIVSWKICNRPKVGSGVWILTNVGGGVKALSKVGVGV